MARTPLSEQEIERFRSRMCDVATAQFAEHGFRRVTMRALANELGCSPMTPYRYFENKQAIIAACRNVAFLRFGDALRGAAAKQNDPLERIAEMARAYVAFALGEPDRYQVMFRLDQREVTDFPMADPAGAQAWHALQESIKPAVDAGLLEGDLLTLAHAYWISVHGVVALHLAGKLVVGRGVEELSDMIVAAVTRGLAPQNTPGG